MSALVVDASVAVKWYLPEEDSETALALLGSAAALHAPGLLRLEVANAFWKHARAGQIDQGLWALARPRLERSIGQWHDSASLLDEAFAMAGAMGHPVYDCLYLALARHLGAKRVSADRRLIAKMRATGQAGLLVPLAAFAQEA